jgi:hypothetical protein
MGFAAIPIIGGIIGSQVATKAPVAIAHASRTGQIWQAARGFFPSGQFGIGYTGGAYLGYGATNTIDPFNIHKPKYKYSSQKLRMAYGMYGYGRYRRRYSRFRRRRYYRRYSRYRRRGYY